MSGMFGDDFGQYDDAGVMDLGASYTGKLRVLDASTGAPVAGAQARLTQAPEGQAVWQSTEVLTTDADGYTPEATIEIGYEGAPVFWSVKAAGYAMGRFPAVGGAEGDVVNLKKSAAPVAKKPEEPRKPVEMGVLHYGILAVFGGIILYSVIRKLL